MINKLAPAAMMALGIISAGVSLSANAALRDCTEDDKIVTEWRDHSTFRNVCKYNGEISRTISGIKHSEVVDYSYNTQWHNEFPIFLCDNDRNMYTIFSYRNSQGNTEYGFTDGYIPLVSEEPEEKVTRIAWTWTWKHGCKVPDGEEL